MVDKAKADNIARKLRQTIVAASNDNERRFVSTGSRLHVGNAASGDDRPFTKAVEEGGVPNMVLVVDMSGSMGGDFVSHAQVFIAAFLRLLRSGDITGSVWLTGGNKHAHIPANTTDKNREGFTDYICKYMTAVVGAQSVEIIRFFW